MFCIDVERVRPKLTLPIVVKDSSRSSNEPNRVQGKDSGS